MHVARPQLHELDPFCRHCAISGMHVILAISLKIYPDQRPDETISS